MATPALKALRKKFANSEITFLANPIIKAALTPNEFCDKWLDQEKGTLRQAKSIKNGNYDCAILFKNSISCAISVLLGQVKERVGYDRDMRGFCLTKKMKPEKLSLRKYKPRAMMTYYLELLNCFGIDESCTKMELSVSSKDIESAQEKLKGKLSEQKKLAVIVPGGAFGPSKCWPQNYYAELSDKIIEKYDCDLIVSVAPNEKEIADGICKLAKHELINLAQTPLTLGELKGLYSKADIVVSNDTGPRHFAVALDRKIVTLFGPNNPLWIDGKHPLEIQIVADVPCAPCGEPICPQKKRLCMESITVEKVMKAVDKLMNTTF